MSRALDSWDDQPVRGPTTVSSIGASTSALKSKINKPGVVVDDWEEDDGNEDDKQPITDELNKQIWEDANTRVHHPMPSVILVRGATSTIAGTVTSPSLPLNQPPPVRILKRPSSNTTSTQSSISAADAAAALAEALKERERKYQEARERIFGVSSGSGSDISHPTSNTPLTDGRKDIQFSGRKPASPNPPSNASVHVIREPRGPGTGPGAIGFGQRRNGV